MLTGYAQSSPPNIVSVGGDQQSPQSTNGEASTPDEAGRKALQDIAISTGLSVEKTAVHGVPSEHLMTCDPLGPNPTATQVHDAPNFDFNMGPDATMDFSSAADLTLDQFMSGFSPSNSSLLQDFQQPGDSSMDPSHGAWSLPPDWDFSVGNDAQQWH